MHIWGKIKQNVGLNVDTWLYDIVYGSSAWILLDRTPGVSMTMIPFREGNTYRGITLQRNYFYSAPVRPTHGSDDEEIFMAGFNLPQYQLLKNNDQQNSYVIDTWFDYDFIHWDNVAGEWRFWSPQTVRSEKTSTHKQVTFLPDETKRVWTVHDANIRLPSNMGWCNSTIIHDSFHWTVNTQTYRSGDYPPPWNAYWSDSSDSPSEPEILHFHPGDISGKSPPPPPGGQWDAPYLAADGVCNIGDVALVGAHWQHNLPCPTNLGPYAHAGTYEVDIQDDSGSCRRADINCDNKINIGDVAIIASNWQRRWLKVSIAATASGTIALGTIVTFTDTVGPAPFMGNSPYTYFFWMKSAPLGALITEGLWSLQQMGPSNIFTYTFNTPAMDYYVMNVVRDVNGRMALSSIISIRVDP